MTSEIETLKTNEFLRRRKLRLQQVREQSKDIAKKLRIRAKVEKLRHIVELDEQKENEYLERQERLVEQLEQVYARGRKNAGAGHKQAFVQQTHVVGTEATSTGTGVTKSDKSKIRAREATAELRQKKQEELDKKNQLLERKLKAREAANEISREKCKATSNSKEPSAQGTEGSERVLRRHSPCEVQCEINNEQAESKAVETDHIALEDRPVSASILNPESSSAPRVGKPDNPPSSRDAQIHPTPNKTNSKDIYNIFHSKSTQDGEKGAAAAKARNDMGTQWDNEFIPNEWVPTVPKLKLPDDDKVSTVFIDAGVSKPRRTNNLFAVSEDMPSALRSKRAYSPPPLAAQSRSSLTLVSEYLHQRQLRLREHEPPGPSRRRLDRVEDLANCKQTIMWARSAHNEGINYTDLCSVHDEQVIPVPNWQPGNGATVSPNPPCTLADPAPSKVDSKTPNAKARPCGSSPKVKAPQSCGKVTSPNTSAVKCKVHDSGLTNADINKISKSVRPLPKKAPDSITLMPKGVKPMASSASSNIIDMHQRGMDKPSSNAMSYESSNIIDLPPKPPSPVIRGASPFRRNKLLPKRFNPAHTANPEPKTTSLENDKATTDRRKKSNVTMYNHFTKDKRDVAGADSNVLRDDTPAEDAYTTALRQPEGFEERPRHERPQASQNRARIASDKQTVEKEYRDTMAFLSSLAKAQTNSRRPIKKAYMDEERQQNVEERHQRKMQHEYRNIEKDAMRRQTISKSPPRDGQGRRAPAEGRPTDFLYSWMPVPESDASLFVHTIPTAAKPQDNVKFQNVDCYHEYRSRHKHTPPTRDKHSHHRARIPAREPDSPESECTSHDSRAANDDRSLDEEETKKSARDSSDAERVIVYKILESKRRKEKRRKRARFAGERVRSMTAVRNALVKTTKVVTESGLGSLERLNEGVYKHAAPKGQFCSLISSKTTNIEFWQASSEAKPWWDNIQSLYFPASNDKSLSGDLSVDGNKNSMHAHGRDIRQMQWDCGDKVPDERSTGTTSKRSQSTTSHVPPKVSHLTFTKPFTSTVLKETVQSNTDTLTTENMGRPDGGYVKLAGDKRQDTEKLILGAAGLLDDDGYEVVIQLRKKDTGKKPDEQEHQLRDNPSQDLEGVEEATTKLVRTVSSQSSLPYLEPALEEKVSAESQPTHDTEPNPLQSKVPDKAQENAEPTRHTACTQTSLHTPSQRSLNLMSSSTSTAYMSPPEMILPACLKHHSETNTDKLSDSFKSYSIKNQCSTKRVKCGCRKCTHVEKADVSDEKITDHARESTPQVPPNTARSEDVVEAVNSMPSRECTCPKCGCDKRAKSKQKRRNRRYQQSSDKDNAFRKKIAATTKLYREELNPIIKDYVKRLLTLNKDELKAIEVLNQECSSVTTPGSSIMNIDSNVENKRSAEAKLSLEHLKKVLLKKIYEESKKPTVKTQTQRKKKPVHKIKSLNISKHLLRKKSDSESTSKPTEDARLPSSTSTRDNYSDQERLESMVWNRSPRLAEHKKVSEEKNSESSMSSVSESAAVLKTKKPKNPKHQTHSKRAPSLSHHNINPSDVSSSTDSKAKSCGCSATKTSLTYQREPNINKNNCEENLMAIAETKVQNIERIANLTEKCTQRLSNLAKVLEEVRKNKSSAFSHLSTGESSSESEHKPNKKNVFKSRSQSYLTENNLEAKATIRQSAKSLPAKSLDSSIEVAKLPEFSFESTKSSNVEDRLESAKDYPSILEGIPKPGNHVSLVLPKLTSEINNNGDCFKRGKPPPALARIKHGPEDVVPHELSTVVEVDSPMSMKFKPQETLASENRELNAPEVCRPATGPRAEILPNPDLLQSNVKLKPKGQSAKPEGSKFEMMDLNKFNEIMLKPFVSIEEFAKQCNVHELAEGSNIGDVQKELMLNDDMSSMHSEGSLPDVIGELLKRNLITEPFKFDTASNVHSTTISSESSISVLALSKFNNKEKKKPYISTVNKEIAETSDTLSVSSNPDLENAFKKLGLGWASSTLKKTKERLALSSSSSSSSCSQKYMLKAFEKHESPVKKLQQNRNVSVSTLKNAEQQTLHLKQVTVQEFLTNELAGKITFHNKSHRDETEQEFISLHETRMPEEMKHSSVQERSAEISGAAATRARTSTPVQLFKSLTYRSSSSSNNNLSNGLFSNVDDLSSVKVTSSSLRNHSTSDKDDLTIPNFSLKLKRNTSDVSKSD